GFSGSGPAVAFGTGEVAHAGVEEPGLIGAGFFAVVYLETRGVSGGKVAVRQALLKDGIGDLAVQGQAFGLLVFFVPPEVEPAQTIEDGVDRGIGIALDVCVIEAEDHGSSVMTGVEPVEDEGTGTANVQETGGGRRKSNTKHNF